MSNGFILSFFINLFFNIGWGILALFLFILHKLAGISGLFPLVGLGLWVVIALAVTAFLSWGISCGNTQTPKRENRNPYSVKETPAANAPIRSNTGGSDHWADCACDLWNAVLLIGVSEALFVEIMKQVNSGERDPEYDPIFLPHSFDDKVYYFLECLCDMGFIAYHDCKNLCEDVAASLNRSAEQQNLPTIPPGLLEAHPMEQDTWKPENQIEMLGGRVAVYIARMVSDWRVFLIDDGSDGCYVGAVSHENAGTFLYRMCSYFMELGCHYSAHLLGEE